MIGSCFEKTKQRQNFLKSGFYQVPYVEKHHNMTGNSHGVVYFCGLDNFMTDMAVGVELLLMLSNL